MAAMNETITAANMELCNAEAPPVLVNGEADADAGDVGFRDDEGDNVDLRESRYSLD